VDQPPQKGGGDQFFAQATPGLLLAAVVGVAGLFLQVARLEQNMTTLLQDVQEMKSDSKERITKLEERVRELEIKTIRPR